MTTGLISQDECHFFSLLVTKNGIFDQRGIIMIGSQNVFGLSSVNQKRINDEEKGIMSR